VGHFGHLPGGRFSTTKVRSGSSYEPKIASPKIRSLIKYHMCCDDSWPGNGKLTKLLNKNGRRNGLGSLPRAAPRSRRRSRRWLRVLRSGRHRPPSIRSAAGMISARVSRAKIANIELRWRSSARTSCSIRFRIHHWRPGQLRPDLILRPEPGDARPTGPASRCALRWSSRPRYRPASSAAHTKGSFRSPHSGGRPPSHN
jgi:hypothetical protein